MAKVLAQIEAHNIGNIRLFNGRRRRPARMAARRSLGAHRPDPIPTPAEAAALEAALRAGRDRDGDGALADASGANFRFVSDIDDYCAWTLAHLLRSPDFRWLAERADDWRPALGRLHHDALRPPKPSARTCGELSEVRARRVVGASWSPPSAPSSRQRAVELPSRCRRAPWPDLSGLQAI